MNITHHTRITKDDERFEDLLKRIIDATHEYDHEYTLYVAKNTSYTTTEYIELKVHQQRSLKHHNLQEPVAVCPSWTYNVCKKFRLDLGIVIDNHMNIENMLLFGIGKDFIDIYNVTQDPLCFDTHTMVAGYLVVVDYSPEAFIIKYQL